MSTIVPIFDSLLDQLSLRKGVCTFVLCPHCKMEKLDPPFRFPLELCELAVSEGRSHLYCRDNPVKPVRIDQLVPDVVLQGLTKIEFNEIQNKEKITTTPTFEVFKGVWAGQIVLVKQLKDRSRFKELQNEAVNMSGLHHRNIVAMRGVCLDVASLVLEYMPFGNLYSYIHDPFNKSKRGYQTLAQISITLSIDVANGMNFLHSATPPVVHKSLKSSNILLGRNAAGNELVAKVDFGTPRTPEETLSNIYWMAPEVITKVDYTTKSDVYSFGIILWELLTTKHPFSEFTNLIPYTDELQDSILQGLRPTIPDTSPRDYTRLIEDCWNKDVNRRPSFSEILRRLQAFAMRFSFSSALFPDFSEDETSELATEDLSSDSSRSEA